jgi:hypothetical protein
LGISPTGSTNHHCKHHYGDLYKHTDANIKASIQETTATIAAIFKDAPLPDTAASIDNTSQLTSTPASYLHRRCIAANIPASPLPG